MLQRIRVAVDIMGGDKDPQAAVSAVCEALKKYHGVSFILFGDKDKIEPEHMSLLSSSQNAKIVHVKDYIKPTDKPSHMIRKKDSTSMGMAIMAVKEKTADVCVSSGNTGALMAMAKHILNVIPGIKRPAICGFVPSITKPFVTLDLGGNVDATPEILVQFAIMGNAFFSCNFHNSRPKFALLNVGSEEGKGNSLVKDAFLLMKDSNTGGDFVGYVEGDAVYSRGADVVVCDGFTGNVWLKALEGIAKAYLMQVKGIFSSSLTGKISYSLLKEDVKSALRPFDPKRYNGAMFVGLDGICIKSHGGSDADGFLSAINTAVSLTRNKVNEKIKTTIEKTLSNSKD